MRILCRLVTASAATVSPLAFGQQQDFSKVVVKVHKVAGNIYMLAEAGGKSLERLKKDKVLEPWKQFNGTFFSADAFIDSLYNEQSGKQPGELLKQ